MLIFQGVWNIAWKSTKLCTSLYSLCQFQVSPNSFAIYLWPMKIPKISDLPLAPTFGVQWVSTTFLPGKTWKEGKSLLAMTHRPFRGTLCWEWTLEEPNKGWLSNIENFPEFLEESIQYKTDLNKPPSFSRVSNNNLTTFCNDPGYSPCRTFTKRHQPVTKGPSCHLIHWSLTWSLLRGALFLKGGQEKTGGNVHSKDV